MSKLVLHPDTEAALQQVSGQAILLAGPAGNGKGSVARLLAARLLQVEDEQLEQYPYLKQLTPENTAISIDAIRELQRFMSLKIPGRKIIGRVAIIEQAETMGSEAQNALLKLLEEPPADSVIILTSNHEQALLPTIRSRLQTITVKKPAATLLQQFCEAQGYTAEAITQAMRMTGGLPGATLILLGAEQDHPQYRAVQQARELLQKNSFERLVLIDSLAKQRPEALAVVQMLGQMAQVALGSGSQPDRWQAILKASYTAEEQLSASAQTKIVLTNLVLAI